MTQKIVQHCVKYGTGQDTLRCLALGTVDEPPTPNAYNFYINILFILGNVFIFWMSLFLCFYFRFPNCVFGNRLIEPVASNDQ